MSGKTRILLVDDQKLFREGLSQILTSRPEFELTGECSSVREAMESLYRDAPDLVLLDVNIPGEHAMDLLNVLPATGHSKVLLLTALDYGPEIARLLNSGASGIFSKTSGSEQLPLAIREVLAGHIWIDEVYKKQLIAAASQADDPTELPSTSAREHQILQAVLTGMTNKAIANDLNISEPSVKAGLQRLFKKFGVSNRAQLVAVAARILRQNR